MATLRRDLGEAFAVEVSPRYVVSDNVGLSATWQLYRKSADSYTGDAGVDLTSLQAGSDRMLQRAMVSITYSTMAQYFRRQARTPMEFSFSVGRSLSGNGGAMKQSITALTMRVYNQLLEGRK